MKQGEAKKDSQGWRQSRAKQRSSQEATKLDVV
jgi:hypothetical protein